MIPPYNPIEMILREPGRHALDFRIPAGDRVQPPRACDFHTRPEEEPRVEEFSDLGVVEEEGAFDDAERTGGVEVHILSSESSQSLPLFLPEERLRPLALCRLIVGCLECGRELPLSFRILQEFPECGEVDRVAGVVMWLVVGGGDAQVFRDAVFVLVDDEDGSSGREEEGEEEGEGGLAGCGGAGDAYEEGAFGAVRTPAVVCGADV